MAITYSAGAGTEITTSIINGTLGDQAQANGTDELVMDNVLTSATNYQSNAGVNTTYIGRLVVLRRGGTEETRLVTDEIVGTGATRILTIHEPWISAPVSADNIDFAYTLDDIENGGAGGGVGYNSRTGVYEFSNDLHIGQGTNFAWLQLTFGEVLEVVDSKSTTVYGFDILNNGRFDCGYLAGGQPIGGGIITGTNNSASEPWMNFLSGAITYINDTTLNAALNGLEFTLVSSVTSNVNMNGCVIFRGTDEARLFDGTLTNVKFYGDDLTTEYIRLNAGTIWAGGVISKTAGLNSTSGDTTTETLTVKGILFTGNSRYITLNSNKTWNVINPNWGVTVHGDFSWDTTTANLVNELYSLELEITEPDGTAIVSPRAFIYRGLLDAVTNEALDVDVTGTASGIVDTNWIYRKYETNSNTDTYTDHALRVYKYGYTPFIASLVDNEAFIGSITLITDPDITEATPATAITNGAGIVVSKHATGETDTRPMKVFKYDGGTGTVPTIGETVTSGTATGVVVEYIGDAVSGTLVVDTWNGTEFIDNTLITGGASSFSSTTDIVGFYEEYTWHVAGNAKNLAVIYDYLAAKMEQGTLDAIFDKAHEWGADEQAQLLYNTGSGYTTERNIAKTEGVWISNTGTGTIAYMTADDGTTYVPPVQYSFTITGLKINSEVRIYKDDGDFATNEEIAGVENSGTSFTYNYIYAADQNIYANIIHISWIYPRLTGLTLSNLDQSIPVQPSTDRVYNT